MTTYNSLNRISTKGMSIMHYLQRNGASDRLEIERGIAQAPLADQIGSLRDGGYIQSMPKVFRQLVKYKLTDKGLGYLGAVIQRQDSLRYRPISEIPPYVPKDATVYRPGSQVAYQLPSRGMRG